MVEVEAGPGDGSGASGVPGSRSEDAEVEAGADGGGGGGGGGGVEVEDRETGVEQRDAEMPEDAEKKEGEKRRASVSSLAWLTALTATQTDGDGVEGEGRRVAGDKRGKSQLTEKGQNYFRNKVNISFHNISGKLQTVLEKNMI